MGHFSIWLIIIVYCLCFQYIENQTFFNYLIHLIQPGTLLSRLFCSIFYPIYCQVGPGLYRHNIVFPFLLANEGGPHWPMPATASPQSSVTVPTTPKRTKLLSQQHSHAADVNVVVPQAQLKSQQAT